MRWVGYIARMEEHTAFLCENINGRDHAGCGDVCRVIIADFQEVGCDGGFS
jgi:hypothetical protein